MSIAEVENNLIKKSLLTSLPIIYTISWKFLVFSRNSFLNGLWFVPSVSHCISILGPLTKNRHGSDEIRCEFLTVSFDDWSETIIGWNCSICSNFQIFFLQFCVSARFIKFIKNRKSKSLLWRPTPITYSIDSTIKCYIKWPICITNICKNSLINHNDVSFIKCYFTTEYHQYSNILMF